MFKCPKCKLGYVEPHVDWIGGNSIILVCRNCGHVVRYEPVEPSKQTQSEFNRLYTQKFIEKDE